MAKLKVEYVAIDVPKPWDRNPKKHNIKAIEKSMDEFDITQPILLQCKSNKIIAGHGRYEAMKNKGMKEVPVVFLPLSDAKAKAYALVDNNLTMIEGWHEDKLNDLLEEIKVELPELDLDEMGFGEHLKHVVVEDDVPEPPKVAKSKRGEIYALGNHRLMCGDATSKDDMTALMRGERADMVFTDPPYSVGIGKKNRALQSVQPSERIVSDIESDNVSVEETAKTVWKPAFELIGSTLKDGGSYYVTAPQGGDQMMMMMMMMQGSIPCKHELIWVKNQPTFSMGRLDYDYKHEPILYGWKGKHAFVGSGEFTKSIWEVDRERKCDMHPTMKPVRLVANAILNSSQTDAFVLDPFGGSGTTLIACEQLGRMCYMMEIDPIYVDVIIVRWEKLTGKKAIKCPE